MASSQLYLQGLQTWGRLFSAELGIIEFITDTGNSDWVSTLNQNQVHLSGNTVILTGSGASDTVRSGETLTIWTGVYYTAQGNWTEDKQVACAMGMSEFAFTVENNATNTAYTYTMNGGAIGAFSGGSVLTLERIGEEISKEIRSRLSGMQTAGTNGRLSLGTSSGPIPPPTAAQLQTNKNATSTNFSGKKLKIVASADQKLTVTFSLAGEKMDSVDTKVPVFNDSQVPLTMKLADLAVTLNTHLGTVLGAFQQNANIRSINGVGRIVNDINVQPNVTITLADVDNLEERDIYDPGTSGTSQDFRALLDASRQIIIVASAGTASANAQGISNFGAWALASAINHNKDSQFWAMLQSVNSNGQSADMVYVFAKEGGNLNNLLACDVAASDAASRDGLNSILFENTETAKTNQSGTTFSLGGEKWASMKPTQTKANLGNEVWNVTIEGRDVGKERDIWIANAGDVRTPALGAGIINGMNRDSFVEIQNAANGNWAGAEVRTQSTAQEALDAITASINAKDKIRADLGAMQNRLENTMTNLTIQAENLQASESRISDVDVATEMTEFTKNNVLSQAATSMLAQANSLSQLALSLIW
jgi:flagellin-like hook-associated protein FlgL